MKLTGLLLLQSLRDEQVPESLTILKMEMWVIDEPADFQSERWIAVTFEGDAAQADAIAEEISRRMKPRWYADFTTDEHVYVIFTDKVFKYPKGDRVRRAETQAYAVAVGVPETQLDWGEGE